MKDNNKRGHWKSWFSSAPSEPAEVTEPFLSQERGGEHPPVNQEKEEDIFIHPRSLTRRWLVLLTFIFLSVMNNFTQFAFSSIITVTTRSAPKIPSLKLTLQLLPHYGHGSEYSCNSVYDQWIYNPIWGNVVDRQQRTWHWGNRTKCTSDMKIFISAILNCIGGWVRFWPGSIRHGYPWLLLGQCFCAVSQSFIDIAGPKIAANWFPPKERTTATALAQGPIFVAVLLSYAVTPRVVKVYNMHYYLLVQAIAMMMATVLIFAFFSIPPSYSAAVGKMKFWDAVKTLVQKRNFIIMFFVFSITLGTAMAFSVLMDQIVAPAGYSNREAGIMVTVWISGSIVGGALGGPIVDRTHAYKPFMVGSLTFILLGCLVFTLTLQFAKHNLWLLSIIIGFVGLGAAGIPAILEATVETIYPVPEATAMGILFLGLNVTAIVFTLGMEQLRNPHTGSMVPALYTVVGLCAIACLLSLLFKGEYKRLEFEKRAQEQEEGRETNSGKDDQPT